MSSVPKHVGGSGYALTPRTGRFVRYGSGRRDVALVDADGNRWPLVQVSILGSLGSGVEGSVKLPRPWEYRDGVAVVRGDTVWIDFDRGSPKRPVVTAIVRELRADAFLPERHDSSGADVNRYAARLAPLDAAGEEVGRVEVEAGHGGRAQVRVSADDGVRVEVGDVVLQASRDRVEVTRGGSPSPVVLEGLQPDLAALLGILSAFVASCATAVTAAQIAGYAAAAQTAWTASTTPEKLAASGYSSARLRTE